MALMMGAFYGALIDAGASEPKACAAAEEAVGTTEEFANIRHDIQALRTDLRAKSGLTKAELKQGIQKLRGEFNTMRSMVGFSLVLTVVILFMIVRVMPHS